MAETGDIVRFILGINHGMVSCKESGGGAIKLGKASAFGERKEAAKSPGEAGIYMLKAGAR